MKKSKGPNWRNIKRLRDGLAASEDTDTRKFSMPVWIRIISGKIRNGLVSVGQMRKNGEACGTVACLAGETVIRMAPANLRFRFNLESWETISGPRISSVARKILGLSADECDFMFTGMWYGANRRDAITRAIAIQYLDKVLATKAIRVRLW